ncbi:hypothetical protein AB0G71_26915 [Streptomyces sp. NPDC020403]|uniref:hypothetical protein n=1 Tax=unclassified Streptomyces TaxID=2593676 RepID=UPI00340DADF6
MAPGVVDGEHIRRVPRDRAEATGRSQDEVTADALGVQVVKYIVDPARRRSAW